MAAFWTLVTGLCCMAVIRVIQHMDQHLPGMEAGDMALLWLLAGVVFFCDGWELLINSGFVCNMLYRSIHRL